MVAVVGVLCAVAWTISFAGFHLPGLGSSTVLMIGGVLLLWSATVSGPTFRLAFPTQDASNERKLAERQFEDSKTPEGALKVDLKRINEYYTINQKQAISSFRWAIFSMLLGLGTIIAGIWFFYLRNASPDTFMASLSTAAGCVINLISGLFLYLHTKTQERSLYYYQQLARIQKLSVAITLIEADSDEANKREGRNLVIRELIQGTREPASTPIAKTNDAS